MEGIICPPYLEPMLSQTLGIIQDTAIDACKRSSEMLRPCMMLRPTIKKCDLADGSIEYVAQYPDDYGVVAIGKTPEEAYLNFDKAWKGEPIEPSDPKTIDDLVKELTGKDGVSIHEIKEGDYCEVAYERKPCSIGPHFAYYATPGYDGPVTVLVVKGDFNGS